MQARLMEGHTQVAVTGAHGKTSTTAMTAAVVRAGGLDPSVLVGAVCDNLGSNALLGRGDYFVAEADESDGSFLYLAPQVAVITNLDREHLDFYRDLDHIRETFARYLAGLPPEARIVAWGDDPYLPILLKGLPQQISTYSLNPAPIFTPPTSRRQAWAAPTASGRRAGPWAPSACPWPAPITSLIRWRPAQWAPTWPFPFQPGKRGSPPWGRFTAAAR